MTQQILVKRSATAAKVPLTTDLALGEVSVNTYDGKMYIKKNNGSDAVVQVGGVSSVATRTGDVTLTSSDVGLGNVNNTSDINKPVSTAQSTALALKANSSDLSATTGAGLVGWTRSSVSADITTVSQMLSAQKVSLWEYAHLVTVKPTPSDPGTWIWTPALQAAISYIVSLGGGIVEIPLEFQVSIDSPLTATRGVLLRAPCRSDYTTNTNGSGSGTAKRAAIFWAGTSNAGFMYTITPTTVGNVIWGGGSEGIEWIGNSLIAGGVHFDNTKFALFDGKAREFTYTGLQISSFSGTSGNFSQQNHIRRLEFVYGADSRTQAANGITVRGNTVSVPGTQQQFGIISGLVYDGYLLDIAENDNCQGSFITASASGAGGAIKYRNLGFGPANSNVMNYACGKIDTASGCENRVLHYTSEAGGMTGSGSWDGDLQDYVTMRMFESHKYAMRKKINIGSSSFKGDGATSSLSFALQIPCVTLVDATSSVAGLSIPQDYDLANGVIEGVELYFGSNGTSGGNYRVACKLQTRAVGVSGVTPEANYTQTFAAAAQYVIGSYTFTFAPEIAYAQGDMILLGIQRLGADALDTNTDAMCVLGARILYRSTGPDSAGSGTYTVPAWN